MIRHLGWFFALLAATPIAFCNVTLGPADRIQSVVVPGDRGSVSIEARGLVPDAPVRAYVETRGHWLETSHARVSNPGETFHQPAVAYERFELFGSEFTVVAVFVARAVDDSPVDLRIRDQRGVVHCQARTMSGEALCIARVPHHAFPRDVIDGRRALELAVQVEARGAMPTSIKVSGFWSPVYALDQRLELLGDVNTNALGIARLAMPFSIRRTRAGKTEAMLLSIENGTGIPNREAVLLLTRDGSERSPNFAMVGHDTEDDLAASTAHADLVEHRSLLFVVPGNAGSITLQATSGNMRPAGVEHRDGTVHDIELSLHRWEGPPSASTVLPVAASRVPAFHIDQQPAAVFPAVAREVLTLDAGAIEPGLWYAVPRSKTGIPLNLSFYVDFGPATRRLEPLTGHYFNPERSGHGIILAPAGDDWVLIWYTYDEDGRPTWYYAQAPKPNRHSGGSQWLATLYRNVWDGTRTRFQFAGLVQLAALSTDRLAFLHLLNGRVGAENMHRLGDGRCTQRHGDSPLDVTGLWYAPTKSGYGYSVEFIGGTEFYLAYAYDAAGMPRWVTAQQAEGSPRVPLWQVRGPCPSCAPMVTTREIVGTLERTIGARAAPDDRAGFLTLGMDASFANGVPGRWKENRPASLLSRRTGCPGG